MNNNVRLTGVMGLVMLNLAIVFARFFIATKAPGYVAYWHGVTPETIIAGVFNCLFCLLALSGGGWNMMRGPVIWVAFVAGALITALDICIVQNLLL